MQTNIMIIDDNPETLETISLMTRHMKLGTIQQFISADDALGYIHDNKEIALIICDWNMPGKSGLDLLKILRQEGNLTPFIMVTARNDIDSVLDARHHGVNLYISKPFSLEEFQQKVSWVFTKPEDTLNHVKLHDFAN